MMTSSDVIARLRARKPDSPDQLYLALSDLEIKILLARIDALVSENAQREDLAMIVRRLCLRFPNNPPGIVEQALDYLRRKGLQGSVLREEDVDARFSELAALEKARATKEAP